MRKSFAKIVSSILSVAMVVSLGAGIAFGSAGEEASVVAAAETTSGSGAEVEGVEFGYSAFVGFQTDGPFAYRDPCMSELGMTKNANYATQCMLAQASKDMKLTQGSTAYKEVKATNVTSVNPVMKQGATYKASISGIDLKNKCTATWLKKSKKWEYTYATNFNMLFITTNIPLSNKGVKCTNVTLTIDGKKIRTLKEAPCKTDAAGYYQFMIADNYADSFTEGKGYKNIGEYINTGIFSNVNYYKSDEDYETGDKNKLTTLPTKSIEVEYTISGGDWSNLPIVGVEGMKFNAGDFLYQVIVAPTGDTPGQAAIIGLSPAGKANKGTLTIPSVVKEEKVTNTNYKVISVKGISGTVASTVNFGNMTKIPASILKGAKSVKTIIMPNATSVGSNAFAGTGISSVSTGKLTSIGTGAYADCKSLSKVTIGSSVKSIGSSAFSGCTALKSINTAKATSIGSSAFKGCTKLSTVKLGSGLKSIGSSAFSGCKAIKTIKIPANVTSIKSKTFQNCSALKTVTLGKKTKSIGKEAFGSCKVLNKISITKTVKVTKNAFKGCKKSIKISGKSAAKKATIKNIQKAGYKKVK